MRTERERERYRGGGGELNIMYAPQHVYFGAILTKALLIMFIKVYSLRLIYT